MKFIFDFDDVLVNTSKNPGNMRELIYAELEKVGVATNLAKQYLEKERWNKFSLKKMLVHFSVSGDLYEKIMSKNKDFLDAELLKVVGKIGKDNCYIVTYGEKEYQLDKIKRTGIAPLFSKIITTQGSKKEIVEKICALHNDEEVIFIDDKAKHFEDLDFAKYPNLKTILYDERGIEKLNSILK